MKPTAIVYLAGPISKPEPMSNARAAVLEADRLLKHNFLPFVPHLSCLWQVIAPKEYEDWLDMDFAWIEACDVVVRLPGESPGADREVEHARSLGIPVYYGVDDLVNRYPFMSEHDTQ